MTVFGVRCDRLGCQRVVTFTDPYCCPACERGEGHSQGCADRTEAWRASQPVPDDAPQRDLFAEPTP